MNEGDFLLHKSWNMLDSVWVLLSGHILNMKVLFFLIFKWACDTNMEVLIFFSRSSIRYLAHLSFEGCGWIPHGTPAAFG